MASVETSLSSPDLCEVQYRSETGLGYRFRPGLILAASKRGKPGELVSIKLADGHAQRAGVLASRTGLGGWVSLLAIDGYTKSILEGYAPDDAALERPIDFTPALALRPDG